MLLLTCLLGLNFILLATSAVEKPSDYSDEQSNSKPQVKCEEMKCSPCPSGKTYMYDEFGCQMACECFDSVSDPKCENHMNCSGICDIDGGEKVEIYKDEFNCERCRCVPACPATVCLKCPKRYIHQICKDSNNCKVCRCVPDPKPCKPLNVRKCSAGYKKVIKYNSRGCEKSVDCVLCPSVTCDKTCLTPMIKATRIDAKGCPVCGCFPDLSVCKSLICERCPIGERMVTTLDDDNKCPKSCKCEMCPSSPVVPGPNVQCKGDCKPHHVYNSNGCRCWRCLSESKDKCQ